MSISLSSNARIKFRRRQRHMIYTSTGIRSCLLRAPPHICFDILYGNCASFYHKIIIYWCSDCDDGAVPPSLSSYQFITRFILPPRRRQWFTRLVIMIYLRPVSSPAPDARWFDIELTSEFSSPCFSLLPWHIWSAVTSKQRHNTIDWELMIRAPSALATKQSASDY